jgi:NADH:ubiquinone reductase (H+-translocating)
MHASGPHRIVIIGAGFAGLTTALSLAKSTKRDNVSITLVNPTTTHTFTPALYALASTTTDSGRYKQLERCTNVGIRRIISGKRISLIEGSAVAIQTEKQEVHLTDGRILHYDQLVVAVGSEVNYYNILGLEEHAVTLRGITGAETISRRLSNLLRGRNTPLRITVGGAGATGVELSAMIADTVGTRQAGVHVTLLEAGNVVLPGFDTSIQNYVTDMLSSKNVVVKTNAGIASASAQAVTTTANEVIPHDMLIWTGGIQAHHLISTLPFIKERGRIAVDTALQGVLPSHAHTRSDVYVLGDAAIMHHGENTVPWTAQVAIQQGEHTARNIMRSMRGLPLKPFKLGLQIIALPLGKKGGIAKLPLLTLRGRIIQLLIWAAEVRHLASLLPFFIAWRTAWKRFGN